MEHISVYESKKRAQESGESCYTCCLFEWGDGCTVGMSQDMKRSTGNNTYYNIYIDIVILQYLSMHEYVWHMCLCLCGGHKIVCLHLVHLFSLRKGGASRWSDLGNSRAFPVSASPVLGLQEPATTSSSFKTLNPRTKLIW